MNRLLNDLFINHRLQHDAHQTCLDAGSRPGTGPDAGFREGFEPGVSVGQGNCPEGFPVTNRAPICLLRLLKCSYCNIRARKAAQSPQTPTESKCVLSSY